MSADDATAPGATADAGAGPGADPGAGPAKPRKSVTFPSEVSASAPADRLPASLNNNSKAWRPSRSDSASSTGSTASRRSTLPPSLSAAAPQPAPAKRASVSGAMMRAPFAVKEPARWRPATTDRLAKPPEQLQHEEYERLLREQERKPLQQRALEKTAMSLTVQLLILAACYLLGVVTAAVLRWDLGPLAFWCNQGFIAFLFLSAVAPPAPGDNPPPLQDRAAQLPTFEKATLAAQAAALVYVVWSGAWNPLRAEYGALVKALLVQVSAKLGVMLSFGRVVETAL